MHKAADGTAGRARSITAIRRLLPAAPGTKDDFGHAAVFPDVERPARFPVFLPQTAHGPAHGGEGLLAQKTLLLEGHCSASFSALSGANAESPPAMIGRGQRRSVITSK